MTTPDTDEARAEAFELLRPRLTGIAYRMLGSVADAEDVVQETWLRWQRSTGDDATGAPIRSSEAFLVTIATRLSLDRLRRVKAQRETYYGPWLPEPVIPDEPAQHAELADSLATALLVVLETMSPSERAAFVLHDVFEQPYPEIAQTLERSEPAVRQLVTRARSRVQSGRGRYEADRTVHAEVVDRFVAACETADFGSLISVLAPDVVIVSDGGGKAQAPPKPVFGADKVARLIAGFRRRSPAETEYSAEFFNGAPGLVARLGDQLIGVVSVQVRDGLVQSLHLVANPEKLEAFTGRPPIRLR